VVLPDPRKPVIIVMGIGGAMLTIERACGNGSGKFCRSDFPYLIVGLFSLIGLGPHSALCLC